MITNWIKINKGPYGRLTFISNKFLVKKVKTKKPTNSVGTNHMILFFRRITKLIVPQCYSKQKYVPLLFLDPRRSPVTYFTDFLTKRILQSICSFLSLSVPPFNTRNKTNLFWQIKQNQSSSLMRATVQKQYQVHKGVQYSHNYSWTFDSQYRKRSIIWFWRCHRNTQKIVIF